MGTGNCLGERDLERFGQPDADIMAVMVKKAHIGKLPRIAIAQRRRKAAKIDLAVRNRDPGAPPARGQLRHNYLTIIVI